MRPQRASNNSAASLDIWPRLPRLQDWQDTFDTLHRWVQIVGKIRLAKTPLINHWWNVPLYVTSRGLSTSPMVHGMRRFHIDFDFLDHRLHVGTSAGEHRSFALKPMSVADFYRKAVRVLDQLDIQAPIWPMPVEIPDPVQRFSEDRDHNAYDQDPVERFWRALLQADRVLADFRARFIGKVSPVHLFWGGFDLAVTRFSGRSAPKHPGGVPNVGDWVMHEAYSHEVSSAGFWPGTGLGDAAFYAYAYPEPDGFREYPVRPAAAYYHEGLRDFILPYEAVRSHDDPDRTLLSFLQSTYEAVANPARWARDTLERVVPMEQVGPSRAPAVE